jgi:alkylresorcinol/alkylpyrone synthase
VRQCDVLDALRRTWSEHPALLRRAGAIYSHSEVDGRHFVLPLPEYERERTFGASNDLWIEHALELGEAAVRDGLARANVEAADVGTILFTTVTGLATPSIDARLVHRLGLPSGVRRLPLFGLGCVAGAAGLARTADQVVGRPRDVAVLLSVELCSLTLQLRDVSMANLVATALFGDGATAVVVTGDERAGAGPRVVASRSVLYRETERVMGWDVSERGFQLVLSPDVPEVVRRHVRVDVEAFLTDHGLARTDVSRWILHPGGPRVLEAIEQSLELKATDTAVTRASLRRFGNVSSSSVLLVLKDTIEEAAPPPGSFGLVLAMGPGFCSEMVLLQWDAA